MSSQLRAPDRVGDPAGVRRAQMRRWVLALAALAGCGGRTALGEQGTDCARSADCEGAEDRCLPVQCVRGTCVTEDPVDCDDHDPCTQDVCKSSSGACTHPPVTLDLDKDGHRAPLPGKKPGEKQACGDDCDDTNAQAHPGGREVCDGVDNDCNGIVDDDAVYVPQKGDGIRISGGLTNAFPRGLSFGPSQYLASYEGEKDLRKSVYLARVDTRGNIASQDDKLTNTAADSFGGPLLWTGDRYGIAWTDRRDGDDEVYFNRLGPDGSKLGPDVRLTTSPGFSIYESATWTGNEFVVAWQDERDAPGKTSQFQIYGQRVSLDGVAVGGNLALTRPGREEQESPILAAGRKGLGVVWVGSLDGTHRIWFQLLATDLTPAGPPIQITSSSHPLSPTLVFNESEYVIAWWDDSSRVFAAVRDEEGSERVAPRRITDGTNYARYPAIVPLGDRLILVFSADKDGNGYELYEKELTRDLQNRGDEVRITFASGHSTSPVVAFGPKGTLGILFRDDRGGSPQAYFSQLVCEGAP